MPNAHPIFQRYPLSAEAVQTSTGPQPTPYHVYDGHAVLIGGTADLASVKKLLQHEHVLPAQTQSGRALMAVWAVDEPQASHGAHTEMQVSFYVTPKPVAAVRDGAFAVLNFLLNTPGASQLCHGLWNNTPNVVAYNREILGLAPRLARSVFHYATDRLQFEFEDAASGQPLMRGDVRMLARQPMGAAMALIKSFGFVKAMQAAAINTVQTYVTNPIGAVLPHNANALTVSASDTLVAQLFEPTHDKLVLLDGTYSALDFKPEFVEHMRGFKMVYLNPRVDLENN